LAFFFFLAPLVVMVVVNVVYFATSGRRLRPTRRLVQRRHMRDVLQVGGALFALQACAAITSFSDSILISIVLGPESVADVAVPSRLFSVVSLGVAILLTPLWPAYTDALARGEIEWVKRTFRRSLMIVALLALPGAVIMLTLQRPGAGYFIRASSAGDR
jgi:O-antigen/teichoic acid export membrane protein